MGDYEMAFQSAQKACNLHHQAPEQCISVQLPDKNLSLARRGRSERRRMQSYCVVRFFGGKPTTRWGMQLRNTI